MIPSGSSANRNSGATDNLPHNAPAAEVASCPAPLDVSSATRRKRSAGVGGDYSRESRSRQLDRKTLIPLSCPAHVHRCEPRLGGRPSLRALVRSGFKKPRERAALPARSPSPLPRGCLLSPRAGPLRRLTAVARLVQVLAAGARWRWQRNRRGSTSAMRL